MSRKSSLYDPAQFLELAEQLRDDKEYDYTARNRTAIGRAYYAAFLLAKKRLEDLGGSFSEVHRIHEQVITSILERNSGIGNKLGTLRDYRVDADYKMNAKVDETISMKCITISRLILRSLPQIK